MKTIFLLRTAWARRVARVLMMAGLTWATTVHAAPEITWYLYDLPPLAIVDGPRKGEGFIELVLRNHLIPGLPDYQHKIIVVPIQRISLMLKTDPTACSPGLLKNPEREQYSTFSNPYLAAIPSGAFIRRADSARVAHYLEGDGKLSLTKLLAHGSMTIGIDSARSYGATIDGILNPYKGKPNIFGLSMPEVSKNLVQMVIGKRIDLVLGQPFEVPYYLGIKNTEESKELKFYRLAEQAEYVLNHVACAKGEFGQAVIRKIDALWKLPGLRDAIVGYYESWLDEDLRPLTRRLQNDALAGAAKP